MRLEYDVSGWTVTPKQLKLLAPYMIGEGPRPHNGEWDMYCPLHEDGNRSSSLNVETGLWHCFLGCEVTSARALVSRIDDWVDPPGEEANWKGKSGGSKQVDPNDLPTEARVAGWASALLSNRVKLKTLKKRRGLTTKTIRRFEIGWDSRGSGSYRIPIRTEAGLFADCRHYVFDPADGRRKIWSVAGMGGKYLYPVKILEENPEEILICEGEWDALLAIQHGFPTITRTGAAKVWNPEWNKLFTGKIVYLAHDADETGVAANFSMAVHMKRVAKEVRIIHWPYPIEEKHGKDLTDFLQEYGPEELRKLMDSAEVVHSSGVADPIDLDPSDVGVLDTFDARRVGQPLRLILTVNGKSEPGYSVPEEIELSCTRDAGKKCNGCPLFAEGKATIQIPRHDPVNLELMDSNNKQMLSIFRERYGIPPCIKLEFEVKKHVSIEILQCRPSVDHVQESGPSAYKSRRIISIGRHDTSPNTTVRLTGALYPDPRRQRNEFLAWEVEEQETSLDRFELNEETIETLKIFQTKEGQSPLAKAVEIARDLSLHVTKIVGRDEMHVFMDLVWHSVLALDFDGQRINGRVEGLINGDTRTGKSEAADKLRMHYRMGDMVSCESASFAGIIGGLQQHGGSNEWSINWGVVPVGDRRLVVLDEVGGLHPEEIAQMSSVRSSGEAQITKIRSERTPARTRLLWLGNPRGRTLAEYSYGVDAIPGLIGNAEDIARFTIAMAAKRDPKLSERINRPRGEGTLRYSSEACRSLVLWAWSRTPEQVIFTAAAQKAVYLASKDLGRRYVENPPLIQGANVRTKLAALAASLAARTFSCGGDGETVIVKAAHVKDVVRFLDRIYVIDDFGYSQRSKEAIADEQYAYSHVPEARKFLRSKKGLVKFLRSQGRFKRQDIEEITGLNRAESNALINKLHDFRMVRKESGFVVVAPVLHELLRETEIE